ncbi:MAG: Nicotinate dehydrogenase subunit [Pseudomonadota bacterium]
MSQLHQTSVSLKTNPLLSQWLRFEANGSVTVFTGKAELGQGILHALKLMAAHELDLPLDSVHIETANTQSSPDEGMTSGSLSVQDSGLAIRQACAHAAQLLKTYACSSYAELHSHVDVKLPVDLTVPTNSTALTLTKGRDDIEALVQGQPIFLHDLGINVDLTPIKNLLYGRMVRGPGLRCTLRTEGWADAVAGLPKEVQAFRDGSLVGVVAPNEELAEKAASKLQRLLKWDVAALPDCREGGVDLVERAPAMDSQVFHEAGQFHEASKDAKVYEAVYFRPALHHGSMGPSVALAVWESDQASSGLKVWSHTQGIFSLRKDLALALGIDAQQIEVQHVRGAGCYGHNGADDVAYNAAWLARHVPGQCVRVQWTREEEMQQSPLAPAMRVKLQATEVASHCSVCCSANKFWPFQRMRRSRTTHLATRCLEPRPQLKAWPRSHARFQRQLANRSTISCAGAHQCGCSGRRRCRAQFDTALQQQAHQSECTPIVGLAV